MSACVIFILHQKIQKMAKCTFWYQLTQVVPDKVQRAVKWLYVCVCVCVCIDLLATEFQYYLNCVTSATSPYEPELITNKKVEVYIRRYIRIMLQGSACR